MPHFERSTIAPRPRSRPRRERFSYVHVYLDANYSGSSAYFAFDYSNLGLIGWNDKISSFVGLDSATGQFFEGTNYTSFIFGFCCNSAVPYVGNSSNDRFSSVRRTN